MKINLVLISIVTALTLAAAAISTSVPVTVVSVPAEVVTTPVEVVTTPVEVVSAPIAHEQVEQRTSSKVAVSNTVTTHSNLEKQLKCLAINIYKEAGYEPVDGRIAVAQVTMNRVAHRQFPNSVCGVVYEKTMNRITGLRTTCQFSWYCDPNHRNRRVNQSKYQESYDIAKQVLIEGVRLPELETAIFYHATYINPRWTYPRIATIGQHIFYAARPSVILASN